LGKTVKVNAFFLLRIKHMPTLRVVCYIQLYCTVRYIEFDHMFFDSIWLISYNRITTTNILKSPQFIVCGHVWCEQYAIKYTCNLEMLTTDPPLQNDFNRNTRKIWPFFFDNNTKHMDVVKSRPPNAHMCWVAICFVVDGIYYITMLYAF